METRLSPEFVTKLKKVDVRIAKSFRERITIFEKDHVNSELDNHELKEPYEGLRSIDITADYRAIYKEIPAGQEETVAYFTHLGTHKELYG